MLQLQIFMRKRTSKRVNEILGQLLGLKIGHYVGDLICHKQIVRFIFSPPLLTSNQIVNMNSTMDSSPECNWSASFDEVEIPLLRE